jgi:xanthine dehydrogenase YagT iron-sulfur-binding subunit
LASDQQPFKFSMDVITANPFTGGEKMKDDFASGENRFDETKFSEVNSGVQASAVDPDFELDPGSASTVDPKQITRRGFVAGVGALAGGVCIGAKFQSSGTVSSVAAPVSSMGTIALKLTVNGQPHTLSVDPRVTLLDLLRENFALTGSKKGCDHGQCGACTVLANGRRINSCLSLAVVHEGEHITTIEGLSKGHDLHPLQSAFLEHDGFQCGYCTPGQLCSAVALLDEHGRGDASFVTAQLAASSIELTPDEIRERMSGNICRCGAYPGIVSAIHEVSGERGKVTRKA